MYSLVFILALVVTRTRSFTNGPPESVCESRTPNHGVEPQKGECPYAIYSDAWSPGAKTEMAMFHDDEFGKFKGFLVSITLNNVTVGKMTDKFISSDPENLEAKIMCGGTTISHASGEDKSYVYFEWEAPSDVPADAELEVRLTVVQEKEIFWVDCHKYTLRTPGDSTTVTEATATERPDSENNKAESATTKSTITKARIPTTPSTTTTTTTERPSTSKTTKKVTTKAPVTIKRPTKAPVVRKTTKDTSITSAPLIPLGHKRPNPNYQGERHMQHEVISTTQCWEAGNYYTLVAGSGCKKYTQGGNPNGGGAEFMCRGAAVFDPRVCACAFSLHVHPCPLP